MPTVHLDSVTLTKGSEVSQASTFMNDQEYTSHGVSGSGQHAWHREDNLYRGGKYRCTRVYGPWIRASSATNSVTQGDFALGKAYFLAYYDYYHSRLVRQASENSEYIILQLVNTPWYMSESNDTTPFAGNTPWIHANRRAPTDYDVLEDLCYDYCKRIQRDANCPDSRIIFEILTESQHFWRNPLLDLLYFYQAAAKGARRAVPESIICGVSPARWDHDILYVETGSASPGVKINEQLVANFAGSGLLDTLSWHSFTSIGREGYTNPGVYGADDWHDLAIAAADSWYDTAGVDPPAKYLLTEWTAGGTGTLPHLVYMLNHHLKVLEGQRFSIQTRAAWQDWSQEAAGDFTGWGLWHRANGGFAKPAMYLFTALDKGARLGFFWVDSTNNVAVFSNADRTEFVVLYSNTVASNITINADAGMYITKTERMNGQGYLDEGYIGFTQQYDRDTVENDCIAVHIVKPDFAGGEWPFTSISDVGSQAQFVHSDTGRIPPLKAGDPVVVKGSASHEGKTGKVTGVSGSTVQTDIKFVSDDSGFLVKAGHKNSPLRAGRRIARRR